MSRIFEKVIGIDCLKRLQGTFLCVLALSGSQLALAENPFAGSLAWHGVQGSTTILQQAATSLDGNPNPANWIQYHIDRGFHDANAFAFTPVVADGWTIRVGRPWQGRSNLVASNGLGLIDYTNNQRALLIAGSQGVGTTSTFRANNRSIAFSCVTGTTHYVWNSNIGYLPMIVTYKQSETASYAVYRIYCEDLPGSNSDYDWNDHGYTVEVWASQCRNGVDDDGDGLTDATDPGCSSAYDENEGDATSQCQDGVDNDGDGATDYPNDFSCSSRTDNDEANPKSQCQDGVDNDGDGAIDLADFSCQNNRQHNDEANPKSQCQNGSDDDADGLIDLADPGCSNAQDNTEGDGTTQCQDGIDNDGDGATDFPADFSCSSRTDNDETNPKSQCQNGLDDDADGVIDLQDPGCSNAQDNNEGDGTTQCQDAQDNDGDGATDFPNDFSCSSRTDNDETNPKSQCQNGSDDDSDGLIDLADPGCSGAQDNNEADGTSQCQDTRDNDGDGLIDLVDPGCSSPQDNNEGDEASTFTVGVECVTKNADNTTTAYFTYNNTASSEVSFTTSSNRSTVNEFVQSLATPAGQAPVPPSRFKTGLNKGAVVVTYSGSTLAWSVRAPGSAASLAIASSTTPVCAALSPQAECRGYSQGVLKARLGYRNDNPFALQTGVGANNFFSPGAQDRGQPTQFFAGLNKSVFEVTLASASEAVSWNLNGQRVTIDSNLPVCDGSCVDTPTGAITGQLDDVAKQLSKLMNRAAGILASAKATKSNQDIKVQRNRQDADRAKQKSALYEQRAKEITVGFPAVVKTCPEAPAFCQTVDRQSSIEELKGLYANQVNSIKRVIARAYFRNTGATSRKDSIVRQAKALEQQGLAALQQLPRFATECK